MWYTSGLSETDISASSTRVKFNLPKDSNRVLLLYPTSALGYTLTAFDYGQVLNGVDTCLQPVFTPAGGSFDSKQSVTLSSEALGSSYYYTIDGADPVPKATGTNQYYTSLQIEGKHELRAVAVQVSSKFANSPVAKASFTIPDHTGPGQLYGVTATDNTTGYGITLGWQNPSDYDYDHVSISYAGGPAAVTIPKATTSATFTGLSDNTTYTFTFTTYDSSGNAGTPLQRSFKTPDKTSPTVTVSCAEKDYTNLSCLSFSLALSEAIQSFDSSMISAVGASLDSATFNYDSTNSRVSFYLNANGAVGSLSTVSWKIPAGSFKDLAGNANAEISWSIQYYNANITNVRSTCDSSDARYVYAIDYGGSALLEVDAGKHIASNRYPLTGKPIAIKRSGSMLYIALESSSTILRFDLASKSLTSSLSVPGGRYIHDFMIDGANKRILLMDYDTNLTFSDRESYAQFIDLSGNLLSSSTPTVIEGTTGVLAPNGSFGIFVASGITPMTLERYDINGTTIGSHTNYRASDGYYGMAMSPDGSAICCDSYSDTVTTYSTGATPNVKQVSTLQYVAGVVYNAAGTKIYLTPYNNVVNKANQFVTVDASTLSVLSTTAMNYSACNIRYPCLTSDGASIVAYVNPTSDRNSFFTSLSVVK